MIANIYFQVTFSVYHKERNRFKTIMGLRNVTVDLCRLLEGKVNSVFVNMFIHDIKKHSNAFRPCPVKPVRCFLLLNFRKL